MTLVLASGSRRRHELLSRLVPDFKVAPSTVVERPPGPDEDPASYALALAKQKAAEVADCYPEVTVLAADTVVAIDGEILGKPQNEADAVRMLWLLRGKSHTVVTGVAVSCRGEQRSGTVAAEVRMRSFSDDEIARYIGSGEPMDKAGAYAVQGLGGSLVSAVVGCYNTVVGLPLCLTRDLLHACGEQDALPPVACCGHSGVA